MAGSATRNFLRALIGLTAALLSGALAAAPSVSVQTDKPSYVLGQEDMTARVSVSNPGAAMRVDVHVLVAPANLSKVYEWPNWNQALTPWMSNVRAPAGFELSMTDLFTEAVDAAGPPFSGAGSYYFGVALTRPGTTDIVSLAFRPFLVKASAADSEAVGMVFLYRDKDYSSGSAQTDVEAGGVFIDQLVEELDFDIEFTELDRDSCEVVSWESNFTDISLPAFMDAGSPLKMTGFNIPKDPDSGGTPVYVNDSLTTAHYTGNKTYMVSGPGGPDVGAFQTSVTAPAALNLTKPAMSPMPTVNTATPLKLEWNAGSGEEDIWVTISTSQTDLQSFSTTNYELQCRFRDDGSATIKAAKLSQLPTDGGFDIGDFGDLPPGIDLGDFGGSSATLDVMRMNWTTFGAKGLDYGIAGISSGVSGPIDLQ